MAQVKVPKKQQQDPPLLKKWEEKLHKDLDGDGERGESAAHRRKVMSPAPKTGTCPICGKMRCTTRHRGK